MKKTLKKKLDVRFLDLIDETADSQTDEMTFFFSSETPVNRNEFNEILVHSPESVDFSRLRNSAPLLYNHHPDKVIGRVKNAWLEEVNGVRKARATIQWGTSDLAKQIRKDTEIGVLRNISVGYIIDKAEEDEEGNIRATEWMPHEISVVSIPADTSIGIDRSLPTNKPLNEKTMVTKLPNYDSPDWAYEQKEDEYTKESREFSIIRAVQGLVNGRITGREAEIQQELTLKNGRQPRGLFVPSNGWSKRDYTKGSSTQGQKLVGVQHLGDEFIDVLRSKLAVIELGATVLNGLTSDVKIPRRLTSGTGHFVSEGGNVSESTGTFDEISLSPSLVGGFSRFSHIMKLQSNPAIEQLIRDDFVQVIAEEMDKVAIRGGDSNQPNGLMLATGINSVAIGTNGGAITLDKVLDLKASVSTSNGDVSTCGFLTNSSVEGAISKLKDSNGSYHLSPYGTELGQQQIASRRLMISNNVPSTLTKGSSSNNCSALIYGDFSQLLLAMFGDLEIEVDIYSQFQSGGVQVRALQAFDVGVRQPSAFGVIADITT